jgi:2Fe-2S ferredoxin
MPAITFIDSDGVPRTVEGAIGTSLMEVAVKHDVPGIVAECGGACACATCHVYVDEAWYEKLNPPDAAELQMLEFAGEPRPTSRLSCQIRVREHLDGLTVTTPAWQG